MCYLYVHLSVLDTFAFCTFDQQEKTADEIMKEQEALLIAKYGMKPKKKMGMATKVSIGSKAGVLSSWSRTPCCVALQEHKFFDSADWALNKEAAAKQGQPPPQAPPQLPPKLEPTPLPARRISHLDSMDK